jgi:general secretion pathway protein G
MTTRKERRNVRPGFTLTEVLVVVVIIVILASLAVPFAMNKLSETRIDIARAEMKGVVLQAVQQYMLKNGQFPPTIETLLSPSLGGQGSLTQDHITDPWGNPYQLAVVNEDPTTGEVQFQVISQGQTPGVSAQIIVDSLLGDVQ